MSLLSVRPVRREDLGPLMDVAAQSGTGMTTVPSTEAQMSARIERSLEAFAGDGPAGARDIFFFALTDGDTVHGMASIFPNLGEDRPFYSYRVTKLATQVPELDVRAETDVLHLVNDYHGYTEIGTLLVGPGARGRGAGRLLSLSRFAFLGAARERFGPNVMAEIRGWFTDEETSPFWDAVAARFFHMTFEEADKRSASDFRFIADLMPKYPIYAELLPDDARAVIGKPHPASALAMKMLAAEGFSYNRCIDIFDGGPSIECPLDRIRTIRQAAPRAVVIGDAVTDRAELVANPDPAAFGALVSRGAMTADTVTLSPAEAERLGLSGGDAALTSPLRPKKKATP